MTTENRDSRRRRERAMDKVDRVLIGTSCRPEEDDVVRVGLAVARALSADAHVLHSMPPDPLVLGPEGAWAETPYPSDFRDRRKAEVEAQVRRLKTPDQEVTYGLGIGSAYSEILRIADELGSELIVVGATEKKGRHLSSTADKLVRKAECPVLVVRGDLQFPVRRVLVPVDLSIMSGDSLRCGLSLLDQLSGEVPGDIEVVYVRDDLQEQMGIQYAEEGDVAKAKSDLEDFIAGNTSERTSRGVLPVILGGDAHEEILKEADAKKPDLIVLGTHGRHGLERAIIGSVTARVARRTSSSVLVIPPETAFGAEIADAVAEQTGLHWQVPADADS